MTRWLGLLLVSALACAGPQAQSYRRAQSAAERSYAAGRYEEAATHWRQAAQNAESIAARRNAEYRAAVSDRRAGALDRAEVQLEALVRAPRHAESARAAYDLALLKVSGADPAAGYRELYQFIQEHPGHVLAERAFSRYHRYYRTSRGDQATLSWLSKQAESFTRGELGELIAYSYARALEQLGQREQARDQFLRLAQRFGYPKGAYWDDALWHAADLERHLGHPDRAVTLLERLLSEREEAHFNGSYERSRYAQARFRIAEIYRDDLARPELARRHFRRVLTEHPTSLLGDDALWQEALLASQVESRAACEPLRVLLQERPDSRFARCASRLCAELTADPARPCRPYILRTLEAHTNAHSSK